MRRLLRDTVEYAAQRRQFGDPIARFQVLQHRQADMLMHWERADAVTRVAGMHMDRRMASGRGWHLRQR